MRLFALVSPQGTACSETVLCEDHYAMAEARVQTQLKAIGDLSLDPPVPNSWTDVSDNDEARLLGCVICGGGGANGFLDL
ncbi:MAG: hypothetical protein L0312_20095 [Acidobacteria bacterium]|nr:hypothetical protein [Acidobacteriota bacterium]